MFEKKYKVGDLHIVRLGRVREVDEETLEINHIENPFVIVKEYWHNSQKHLENCNDVFNNTLYYRFSGLSHVGGIYFQYQSPLSTIFPTKEKITKKELIKLYNELNELDKEETNEQDKEDEVKNDTPQNNNEDDNKIEDRILKLILTTTDKINALDLSNEKRTEILTSLKTLAEYYISTLITLKSQGQNPTTLSSPITELELECKNKIAEIELSLNDVEKTENLKKQLVMVKQRLK